MTWHLCDDLTPTSPPCKRPTPNPLTNYRRRAGPGLCLPSESIALLLHSIVMVTVAQEANQMIGFPFTTIFFPCGGYLWPPLYGSHLFYFSGCELVLPIFKHKIWLSFWRNTLQHWLNDDRKNSLSQRSLVNHKFLFRSIGLQEYYRTAKNCWIVPNNEYRIEYSYIPSH